MKTIYRLIILFAAILNLQAQEEFRIIENNAFKAGEKLTFDVKYGFVTAGVAEMEIPRETTVPSFDVLFKVRDRYETYIDKDGLFPWRFEQHIREGGYSRDFSAFFDQRRGKAKTTEGTYEIPKYVNDILSAFYITRTFDFSNKKIGDRINLQNFYKDKVYPLDVVYRGKEKITVGAGTFNCIIVEPLVQEGGLFKSEGNIIIWLTDDELKIPVKVKTKVIIGSIDAELTGYEGLAGKVISKVD
jgi:hypothetical protein